MGADFQLDSEIRPQRLSKPRTSTSSTSLLKLTQQKNESSSPPTPIDTHGLGEKVMVVTSPTGEVRSRQDARSKLREYLYAPNNQAQTPSSEEEDDGPRRFSKVAGGLKKRLSRSGSSFTQLPSAKSSSLYLTNSSGSRLLFSSELSLDLEESERIAENIKEKAYADSIAAQNHVSLPVDEDKHPDSVMAPIRRRSLFTPGIATRDPKDILRKQPPLRRSQTQVDLAHYDDPLLPESSPLSQLVALTRTRDGRSTPSDLDYSHLGGLKLGTLRVTNGGAASPAPDAHAPVKAMADMTSKDAPYDHEGIHTACHVPTRSGDSPVVVNETNSKVKKLEGYAETSKAMTQIGGSPLKYEGTEMFANAQDNTICHSCLKSLSTQGSVASTDRSSRSPDRASVMAQNYMSELPGSPFSKSETFNLGILEPGFKPAMHTIGDGALDDEGVDVSKPQNSSTEMWRLFINDAEVRHANSETREDALRILTANAAPVSDTASRSVSPPDSRHRSSAGTLLGSAGSKHFTKADSGYNSNESLQTLSSAAVSSNLEEPSSRLSPMSSQRLSQSLSCPREMPQSISSREKINIPEQPNRPAPIRPSAIVTPKAISAITPRINTSQTSTTTTVTVSYLHTPVDLNGPTTRNDAIPKETSVQQTRPLEPSPTKANKLRKPRPLSQPLPVDLIAIQRNLSLSQADIPPVPSHVSLKHADRLREFPSLEHTFPSLQHTQLSDTLSIEEPVYVPIRFPSPANAVEEESPSKDISITTRLSQYSTREPAASPLKGKRESVVEEEDQFTASDLMRSPSWSDFGRRGREKRRLEKEKASKSKNTEGGKDNTELDEEGLPIPDICRSPSWSAFGGKKKQKKSLELEKKEPEKSPKIDEPKKRNILTRNRSSTITKKERRQSLPNAEATITDFGTVTESLGGSPYDIAKAAFAGQSRAAENTNLSHPRQQSTAIPRTKSTIGMDEEAAAEFARLRSRQRSHSSSRPEMPIRRSLDDRAAVLGKMIRPQSMYANAPPVPTFPNHIEQNEASSGHSERLVHTRSQSKFRETPPIPDISPLGELEQPEIINEYDRFPVRARLRSMFDNVQPTPAFAAVDLPMHRQISSDRGATTAELIRPRSMIIEASPRPAYVPVEKQERRETFNDRGGAPGRNIRPRSMFLDIPPVPALPTVEQVEQKEAQVSRSSSERSMTLIGPRKVKIIPESSKKDIWASPALVEDKTTVPRAQSSWEAHQQAWAERRKSAGDALLQKNQTTGLQGASEPATTRTTATDYLSPASALSTRSRTPSPPKPASRPFHKPLNLLQDTPTRPPPPPPSTIAAPTSAPPSTSPSTERLAGRYEGGLSYGYEPGVGVGGSAGTRSAKTGASRKSIGFSQGYGVDLSDVPIFVAPNE